MRTVEEQLERVVAAARPVDTSVVAAADARGRTLAAPALAAHAMPPFDNSSMDGFAVRFADVATATPDAPVHLRTVADLPAGTALDPALGAGEAARIMTGSPVPTDADVIVPFEDTAGGLADSRASVTVLRAPASAGTFVRRAGSDTSPGDTVLSPGERVDAFALAAAAAAGITTLTVARAPRVAIVSTGSELVDAGETLARGQIPDSNGVLLAALTLDADAEVVLTTRIPDDPDAVAEVLAAASARNADVVVFSGGVSAGAYEPVRQAFEQAGDVEFVSVAMQPGKPQAFGVVPGGPLVFGLPGNPVSVAVSFETFVRPALLAMQGRTRIHRRMLRLRAAEPWRTPPHRRQYLPAVIDEVAGTVRPATAGGSGSHLAVSLARAEAFAIVPADVVAVAPGDLVDVMVVS